MRSIREVILEVEGISETELREAHGGASGFDPRAKLRAYL